MTILDVAKFGAKWLGFIGSALTVLLGIVHVLMIGAHVKWPSGETFNAEVNGVDTNISYTYFASDPQKLTWRLPLFSIRPDIFFEVWTPLIVGAIGCRMHFRSSTTFIKLTENYLHYFGFTIFQGLFATIAYRGALGIIFSIPVWISAFCSFVVMIADDDNACLNLGSSSAPKSGVIV